MKTSLILIALLAVARLGISQALTPYRFEVNGSISQLNLPMPYRAGWHFQQQLTAYFRPRLGVALGFGWGGTANTAPLNTIDPASPLDRQPDPAQLSAFYKRQDYMTNLSLVLLPVLTRRHELKLQAGLSVYRRREVGVDSIFRDDPRLPYRAVGKFTDTRRVVPMVTLGYAFRVSPRWSVGVNGTAYLTGDSRPATTLGFQGSYRFGLSTDSLAMKPVSWQDIQAGVRAGATVVAENNMRTGGRYRTRFIGGLWAVLPLSLTWRIRGEVNYAQRGYRNDEVDLGGTRYAAGFANLNYLEVPLLFRYEMAERWHVYTGPYLAFFLNGYAETAGVRQPVSTPTTNSGVMLGLSYKLAKRLAADLRYQRDLIQFASTPYGGFHSFQATIGWALRKE